MVHRVACFGRLLKVCRARGRSAHDAEDLIQDALLRLEEYRRDAEVSSRAAIRDPDAWLTTTVGHLAIDHRRRERRRAFAEHSVEDVDRHLPIMDPSPRPDQVIEGQLRLAEIKRLLDKVSIRMREMYFLSMAGYKQAEIAKAFEVSLSTVEKELARAVLTLMKLGVSD